MAKVSLRAYNREIEAMVDRGQLDEAIAHSRHILKTYPKHLETYRLLGKGYLESKRNADGVDIFSRILVAVPNDFVANVGMSIIRDEENRLEDAIWHMERAFETQPSNPAIQAELQRLYARRDGVRPPRIRMTRGALAHMYVQGELYPQAISEIKSVLRDDPERADMQALLARAYYKSGLKNEAADVATALLRRYPYALDANRVLAEILGSDHPENSQVYRQRVFEMDPYAALVTGSIFLSSEVSDAAVNIERLDWNGQPVTMQADWGDTKAISLGGIESEPTSIFGAAPPEQPSDSGFIQSAPTSIFGSAPPPEPPPAAGLIASASTSIFGSAAPDEPPAQPAEEIPEFMRAVGWEKSTGLFDESKPAFGEEESTPAESIEQGDLPDWIKAMKPVEPASKSQQDEEIPDWIKSIGAGVIASQAVDRLSESKEEEEGATEWLAPLEGEAQSAPSGETSWLGETGDIEPAPAEAKADDLDWLKKLDEAEAAHAAQSDEPDWLQDLGAPEAETPAMQAETPDWLRDLGASETEPSTEQAEQPDWLKNLGTSEAEPAGPRAEESDWLKGLGEPASRTSAEDEEQSEWLKGLALAGGAAAAAHLAKDDEPAETVEPPSDLTPSVTESAYPSQMSEEAILETPAAVSPPDVNVDQLGVTEQERDDSFAWLESLAAKQGATEGLLTTPEERLEEEPDWVKQAKGLKTPAEQPSASLEDLGKSEQEQDDSFAWLESLAAKQGATEGLLTTPEERLEEEPDWVKQAKDLNAQELAPAVAIESELEQSAAMSEPETQAEIEQPSATDNVDDWLKDLEGTTAGPADETAVWLKGLEEQETPQAIPAEPGETEKPDFPEWMQSIEVAPTEESTTIFAEEAELGSTWMPPSEESAPVAEPKAGEDNLPSWLSELDQEGEQITPPANADDLPAWLLAEESTSTSQEPTIFSDWRPTEEFKEEPAPEEMPTLAEKEEAEPAPLPPVSFEMPAAEPAPVMESTPEPQLEPAPRPGLEGLSIPTVDPVLGAARDELSRNNIPGALDSYARLIKKARYLDEVIYDLREALYRYPVDVNIWQSLGDAYMRANRLQDALDAYTKAEELLR